MQEKIIQKISDEYVSKIRGLGTPLSHFAQAGQPAHAKISYEHSVSEHLMHALLKKR